MSEPAPYQIETPADTSALAARMRDNAAGARRPLVPVGGATALDYGYPVPTESTRLQLTALTRVIDYPARDMTVTVEAGLTVAELDKLLAGERQRLAVDIPQADRATIGGAIAANASGPRRFGLGTLRDYLIGVSAVDAQGREFKAGGRVVKNVAGYDLCKLVIGSLGTLAVITQLTFKLKPRPEATSLLWVPMPDWQVLDRAVARLLTSATRPVVFDALNPRAAAEISAALAASLPAEQPILIVGVEGMGKDVAWQIETLQQELKQLTPHPAVEITGTQADALVRELTAFQVAPNALVSFNANLRASATAEFASQATNAGVTLQAHAGNGIVYGRLPPEVNSASAAAGVLDPLRGFARRHDGNLVIWNCPADWKSQFPLFGDPEPATPFMRHLKQQLDPHNLLNRGKLFR